MGFHPYLAFAGNCREAFTRYQEVFGGELVLLAMSDMPEGEVPPVPEDQAHLITHATLMSDGQLLMGADDPSGSFDGRNQGMCVNCSLPDVPAAQRVYDALSEGGTVQMAFAPTFFSRGFGMCTDRFGTPWMVVADAPDAPS